MWHEESLATNIFTIFEVTSGDLTTDFIFTRPHARLDGVAEKMETKVAKENIFSVPKKAQYRTYKKNWKNINQQMTSY